MLSPKSPAWCNVSRSQFGNKPKLGNCEYGTFWEDRYCATAIEADEHLHRCLVYIDLNMVRAGVVNHPSEWQHSGYREIQTPPKRYSIIDLQELSALCGFVELTEFQQAHRQGVEEGA